MKENQNPIEELNDLSSILAALKTTSSAPIFKTPLFYFDTLQDKVFEKLEGKPIIVVTKSPTWAVRLQQWFWQPSTAWAFSTMIMMMMVATFWFQKSTQKAAATFALHEEVHHYIANNLDEFDEELLAEYHHLQDSKHVKANLTIEELEHYLNEFMD
jgi:hypothetical protein